MSSKRKVALFLTHDDDVQRDWLADAQSDAASRDIELLPHFADDAMTQSQQIAASIWTTPCDALVILAKTACGPRNLLREAVTRERSVVLLNRTSSDMDPAEPWSWPSLRKDFPAILTATTVPDAIETGRLQARQFHALLPGGGNILYVLGDPTSSDGVDRLRGLEEVLAQDQSYNMRMAVGGFREASADAACRRWLRTALANSSFKLDLIGSQSEVMIPGIRASLQAWAAEAKRPDLLEVPITAVDGTDLYKSEVDRGMLAATVETPSRITAAIDLLASHWAHRRIPSELIIELPVRSYPPLEQLKPVAPNGPRRAAQARIGAGKIGSISAP